VGIQDRDYMRERKHGEPPRAPRTKSSYGWALIVVAIIGVIGAGVWWYRNPSTLLAPVVNSLPTARPDSVDSPVPMVDSGNPLLIGTVTKVIDGDTIDVLLSSGPIRVRFDSVDAPEKNQPWGREAGAALADKLGHQEVALDVVTQDRYERLVAVVSLNDENVNAWLVRQGHAWAYRQYLKDPQYCSWEAEAHAGGRGLWALPRDQRHAPWEWRAVERQRSSGFTDYADERVQDCIDDMHRAKPRAKADPPATVMPLVQQPAPAAAGDCRIKGNISSSGHIYHVPGSASYSATRIDTSKGERWFCSEEEAEAAGWRAPRG